MALIGREPMIVHVWRRAVEADCGPVVVATDAEAVRDAVLAAGGEALMTDPDHASGSDRIFEAVSKLDPGGTLATVVNLQGDLPTLDPSLVRSCLDALHHDEADIGTLAAEITSAEERDRSECRQGGGVAARRAPLLARALFHPRHRPPWRGAALPPYRHLCLSARGARTFRVAASVAAREPRAAGATARARGGPHASTSPSLTRSRSVSILRPTLRARVSFSVRRRSASPHSKAAPSMTAAKRQKIAFQGEARRQLASCLPGRLSRTWRRCRARPSRMRLPR